MTRFTTDPTVTVPTEIVADGARSWAMPASFTPDQAAAFVTADDDERAEEVMIADLEAEDLAPDRVLAAKQKELAARRTERLAIVRDREETAIFEAAAKEYGGDRRVGRVRTPEGSIILRPQTSTEIDRLGIRCSADGMKDADRLLLVREGLIATVVHPPRARFEVIVGLFPGLWGTLYGARDKLVDGTVEDAEKKA